MCIKRDDTYIVGDLHDIDVALGLDYQPRFQDRAAGSRREQSCIGSSLLLFLQTRVDLAELIADHFLHMQRQLSFKHNTSDSLLNAAMAGLPSYLLRVSENEDSCAT